MIGIGAGSPEFLTLQAIAELKRADVALVLQKGSRAPELLALRDQIMATHAPETPLLAIPDPPRDRNPESDAAYQEEVRRWHAERARRLAKAIRSSTEEDGVVAFLVWGDPNLYDSTLRIIQRMQDQEHLEAKVKVVPGITAIQVLTSAFAIPLNRIGEAIHITTGRNLPVTTEKDRRNCVVMLDGGTAWQECHTQHTYMWWGAYLGTEHQVLREGYVHEIGEEVAQLKQQLRAQHGWIMDTYLLREFDVPAAPGD